MRTWMVLLFGALTLSSCASPETAKLKDDVEALKRRVAALEKDRAGGAKGAKAAKAGKTEGAKAKGGKVKGGKAKADGAKAKTKAPPGPKGTVVVEGDAAKVALDNTKRMFQPGEIPAGDYSLKAAFGEDTELAKVLDRTVTEGATVTVACVAATKTCAVKEPTAPQ